MKTWRDIGAENAKKANEELRLHGESLKSQRQVDHLKDMSDTLSSVKDRVEDLVSGTELVVSIQDDLSDIKVLLSEILAVLKYKI